MVPQLMISRRTRRAAIGFAALLTAVVVPGSPVAAQDKPLKELMINRDPLLRRLFVKSPDDDVKGLAAKIKAEELTVKHRIKAIRYLSTVDCVAYPEAKAMLVKMLHKDPWEPVRFEAAKALRTMLSTGSRAEEKDESGFNRWLSAWKRNIRRSPANGYKRRYDYCPGCCDKDTLNALVKTAYEMNDVGNCFEPSLRVREMAVEAIKSCGVACDCGPYYSSDNPEMGPPPADAGQGGEVKPPEGEGGEVRPPGGEAPPPSPKIDVTSLRRTAGRILSMSTSTPATSAPQANQVPSLSGRCVVALVAGKKASADPQHSVVHKGRMYQFSTAEAKQQFEKNPAVYEIAYGGFDPVQFVESRQMADGSMLCEYGGRLYCFATHANWRKFLQDTDLYAAQDPTGNAVRQVSHKSR